MGSNQGSNPLNSRYYMAVMDKLTGVINVIKPDELINDQGIEALKEFRDQYLMKFLAECKAEDDRIVSAVLASRDHPMFMSPDPKEAKHE